MILSSTLRSLARPVEDEPKSEPHGDPAEFRAHLHAAAPPAERSDPAEPTELALLIEQATLLVAPPTARTDHAPVASPIAACVGHAAAAIGAAPRAQIATSATPTVADTDTGDLAAPGPLTTAERSRTPLEQAVHDLLGQLTCDDDPAVPAPAAPVPAPLAVLAHDATRPAPAQPAQIARAVPTAPDPPANPSHVHLVIEDGAERVVVTVAVRGAEVHVAMRSSDEATAASLARNAASLDHALRARGLQLEDCHTGHQPRDDRRRDPEPASEREPRPDENETFELEETP